MIKDYVLTTSGFILPSSSLFIEIDKDPTYKENVLGKVDGVGKDKNLSSLVEDGGVYTSPVCNEIYLKYLQDTNNFDNYIAMVDAFAEIFKDVNFKDFILIQAKNTFLSSIGFKILADVIRWELHNTYKDYLVVTSFFRIPASSQVCHKELMARQSLGESLLKNQPNLQAINIFSDLMTFKPALAAMFKFMLTDSNRGGHYG